MTPFKETLALGLVCFFAGGIVLPVFAEVSYAWFSRFGNA